MIKTHKPRGHVWSCPSIFQSSPEIRNIHFADCIPPPSKVLAPDQGAELAFQRSSKRRRVEQLAEDYLNGVPLVINSARTRPQALVEAVEGNERRRTGAKYSLPKTKTFVRDDTESLWEDVDDLSDLLVKATGWRPARVGAQHARPPPPVFECVEEEAATSACKRVRRVKAVNVSLHPSSEALGRAAGLRDRRLQLKANAAPAITSSKAVAESDPLETVSEPDSNARLRARRARKQFGAEWLLRRQTTPPKLSAEDSIDALNRSSFETPSKPSQGQTLEPSSSPAVSIQLCVNSGELGGTMVHAKPIGKYGESWQLYEQQSGTAEGQEKDSKHSVSSAKGSYHTAPEDSEAALDISSRPTHKTLTVVSPFLPDDASTKSAGNRGDTVVLTLPRRQSAPTQSQHKSDRSVPMIESGMMKGYTIAKLNNDTPLLWRKKVLKQHVAVESAATSEPSMAVEMNTPTEQMHILHSPKMQGSNAGKPTSAVVVPALDMSFGHDSFAPALNLALADEHLNTRLPHEQGSPGRTSSVKRAIRRGSLQHGAEVTRIEKELISSQEDALGETSESLVSAEASMAEVEPRAKQEATADPDHQQPETQWAGTQALLEQAHHNLFDSPVPPDIAGHSAVEGASTAAPLAPHISTQAMMAAWSPWSAIKKPAVPPLAKQSTAATFRSSLGCPQVARASVEDSLRQPSSLRFANSSTDSPTQTRLNLTVTKAASQDESKSQAFDTTFDRRSSLRRQSSSQCAQRNTILPLRDATTMVDEASVLPLGKLKIPERKIFREDSDPYRTVEELETTLLVTEMDGVWSQ